MSNRIGVYSSEIKAQPRIAPPFCEPSRGKARQAKPQTAERHRERPHLAAGAQGESLVFPQIGAGVGLSAQIALISRSSQAVEGTIRLFDSMGNPLTLERDGAQQSEFAFQISGDGIFFTELTGSEEARAGYALVEVEAVRL